MRTDRRGVLRAGTVAVAGLAAGVGLLPGPRASAEGLRAAPETAPGSTVGPVGTPALALARLEAGNAAWVAGRVVHPDSSAARRRDVATHQEPFAVVFTCIDSRVPPELVFDQGLGDLMVIRTAAHTADGLVTGSLEYGPAELGAKLLVVMGHQRCGAVTAAVRSFRTGERLPGHLADIGQDLRGPYEEARRTAPAEALVDAVIRAQTRQTVARLRRDALLRPLVEAGKLEVVGGYYSLDTGEVTFGR
ncbi:carbonic anhydrase [Kitasatospora sp. MMS16-BH015]|uniref:carbonic anhydrase n=1 Tax=Kitasatospora sp. MMS16-BH015 TaxID=2018025 RepID=UPI000CA133D3|nr:carbonic anhydrase [Kitasatospora sp. MMS16-BH015]AUG76511.1 carbonic anhydrase [Kitasatospora sp. MMS16-BH015]